MPRKKRPAPPVLHALETLRAELPDGRSLAGEVTVFSTSGFTGLRISVDPLEERTDEPEPPVRPIEER